MEENISIQQGAHRRSAYERAFRVGKTPRVLTSSANQRQTKITEGSPAATRFAINEVSLRATCNNENLGN
jgi:hypothetical protein